VIEQLEKELAGSTTEKLRRTAGLTDIDERIVFVSKNAIEGLGAPRRIGPVTLLLFGGQVLPVVLLALVPKLSPTGLVLTLLAVVLAYLPRLVMALRFGQAVSSAFLHPLGVLALLAIQWYSLASWQFGRPAPWKGRNYGASLSANS